MKRTVAVLGAAALIWAILLGATVRGVSPSCTLLLGYSQTQHIADPTKGNIYGKVSGPATWEQITIGGGRVENWADPAYTGWTWNPYGGACGTITRVVFHVTVGIYTTDPAYAVPYIQAALANARAKWPGAVIFLIPEVAAPADAHCPTTGALPAGSPPYVRASYNSAAVRAAIATVVGSGAAFGGGDLRVSACSAYTDWIGHFDNWPPTEDGYVAQQLANTFNAIDAGAPTPAPPPAIGTCTATWNGAVVATKQTTQAGCGLAP